VFVAATKNFDGRPVRGKPVGHDCFRRATLILEKFPEQFQCRRFVSALPDERVENLAFLVDGTRRA